MRNTPVSIPGAFLLAASLFFLFICQGNGQNPTIQDCLGAIPICQEIYIEPNSPSGTGNFPNEINPNISCTVGELNSIWYTFTVAQSGNFGFLLTPNNLNDDYDWSLFNITNADCEDIFTDPSLVASCNAAGGGTCNGLTGATGGSPYNNQGGGCNTNPPSQNAGFSAFNALVPVTVGNTYVLMVSNWTGSQNGYTIDFGYSTVGLWGNNIPPVIPGTISGPINVCPGATLNYSVPIGTGISNYDWSLTPAIGSISNDGNNQVSITFNSAGVAQLCVTPSNPCATGPTICRTIISSPIPPQFNYISFCFGDTWTCQGQTFINPGQQTFVYDNWLGCDSTIICVATAIPPIVMPPTTAVICQGQSYSFAGQTFNQTGGYPVTLTAANGCDSVVTLLLTVLQANAVIQPPPVLGCGGGSAIQLNANGSTTTPASSNAVLTYSWSGPGIVSGGNTLTPTVNAPGTYTLTVTHTASGVSCSSQASVTVVQNTAVPNAPTVTGPLSPCSSSNYTVTPSSSGPAPTGYTWTVTGGTFVANGANGITVTWTTPGQGQVCVTADNACGPSTPACLTINVGQSPAVPALLGPDEVCEGDLVYYIINPVDPSTVSFNWTVGGNASFTNLGDSILVDFSDAVSGQICVTGTNPCGTSAQSCITVNVLDVPSQPSITGLASVCNGEIATYSVTADPNATSYNWTVPTGAAIVSGAGTNSIEIDWTGASSGNVCVRAVNSCGQSPQACFAVTVNDAPTGTLSGGGSFCAGSGETIDLEIDLTGEAPWDLVYAIDGVSQPALAGVTQDPYILTVSEPGVYTLVSLDNIAPCPGVVFGSATVVEHPLPSAVLSGSGSICQGSGDCVDLTVTLTGTAPWTLVVLRNGAAQAPLTGITDNPYTLTVCQGGTYGIETVTDGNGCSETGAGSAEVIVNTAPVVTNIEVECNGTSTGYTVSFTISGGDPASYTVNGSAAGISAGPPYVFTSVEIPSGDGYSFVVDDANSCNPVTVEQAVVLCNCLTAVGSMDAAPLSDCGPACITATYDPAGESLDGDDALQFILHTGSGVTIINEIARNVTPVFCFDALAGMTYGTTYYISAVVGNDLGGGVVDLTDPCLAVAQGTPVVYYEEPTAALSGDATICVGEAATLTVNFTGPAPYSITYDDGTGSQTVNGINANPYTFDVSPPVTTTYTLLDVSNAECAGTASGSAVVTVNQEVVVSNIGVACNTTATAFTVSFEISGGDGSTYTVLPVGSGTLTPGNPWQFVSDPIAAGSNYAFQVTDINGCVVIDVQSTEPVDCDCISAVGEMDLGLIEECGDGPVSAIYNSVGEAFDGDDVLEFILHTGSGNAIEYPIIGRSDVPVFSFDAGAGMTYGTTYYISAIVGSDDGTGSVNDLNDPCLAVSPGTPVIFRVVPTAVLGGTQEICIGEDAVLPLVFTGDSPWTVEISNGTTSEVISGINSTTYNYVVSAPQATATYTIVASSDEHCDAVISGTATVTVNAPPTNEPAEVTINATNTGYVVCFKIVGGEAPYTVTDGANVWVVDSVFCSDELPCGNGYYFEYDGANGCGPVIVTEPLVECACTTSAGELDVTPQEICGTGPAVAAYDGANEVLDGDDVVDFILHAGDNVPILSNTIPSFNYTGLLSYGVTYYISARAGNNNGSGGVDPADPCLSVTPGAPVTFYQVPGALLSGSVNYCEGETVGLEITVTGGVAPWTVNVTNTLGESFAVTVPASPYTWNVAPSGTTLFSIVSVSDANCTGTGSGLGSVTEQSAPFGSNVTVTTDPTNTFVTVCFTIVGGDAATYSVTGMAGTLTGNQFCSDPISCDQGVYQFFIQDGFACGIDEVTGPIVCNCVSGSGIMTQVEQEVCEFETVSATPATAAQFDGNDTIMYVLHTGSGPALGTIIASGATPSFAYNATTMDCGVTYYISSVVGDDDGTGQVDLTDDCLSVSEGTPVVFNCLPTASISGGGPICAGGTINGTISLTGGGPYTVVVNDGVQDITLPDIASGYAWSLSPGQTTTYALVSVTSNTTGCTNTASGSITVTVNSPVFAGTAQPAAALCAGQGQVFSLADLLTGEDAGGVWTETSAAPSAGGAFNAGAGTFNTAGQAPGTYTFRYFMDALPPCEDDNETVTVIVHPLPVADAGAQQQLTCNASSVAIGGAGSSSGTNFDYAWTLSGSTAVIGTSATLDVTQPGTYELTVTNTQTGCEAKDQVVVTQDISAPAATVTTNDISCFGAADGFIFVETVTGGKPPYLFSINGGPYSSQQQFSGLGGGDYLISVEDANGCETQVVATLIEPQELTAELVANIQPDNEDNYFIELGDELVLTLQSSFAIGDLDTIIWTPAELVSCNDVFCQSVTVAPTEGAIFTVTVERGPCSATDELRLLVRKPRPVFIPNVFSPNNDGHNDILYIFGGRQVQRIQSFQIFNRWGEPVFEATDFPPNDFQYGWDGTHRGKPVNPGVFAYYVEVLYTDGYVELIKGEVSLVR